jgi:hypothetical protein
VLLPNSRDDNDGDECVCVNDNNFLWKNMDNYSGLRGIYTGMCRPHNSAQGVTHVVIYLN